MKCFIFSKTSVEISIGAEYLYIVPVNNVLSKLYIDN